MTTVIDNDKVSIRINNVPQHVEINSIPEIESAIDILAKKTVLNKYPEVIDLLKYPLKRNVRKLQDLISQLSVAKTVESRNKKHSIIKAIICVSFIALSIFGIIALSSVSIPAAVFLGLASTLLSFILAKAMLPKYQFTEKPSLCRFNILFVPIIIIHHEFTKVSMIKSEISRLAKESEGVFNVLVQKTDPKKSDFVSDMNKASKIAVRNLTNIEILYNANVNAYKDQLVEVRMISVSFNLLKSAIQFFESLNPKKSDNLDIPLD